MFKTLTAALVLAFACACTTDRSSVNATGGQSDLNPFGKPGGAGEKRLPFNLKREQGWRTEFRTYPLSQACSRVWQYDYLPNGALARPPQSFDVCP